MEDHFMVVTILLVWGDDHLSMNKYKLLKIIPGGMMKELHVKGSGITLVTLMFHLSVILAALQIPKHTCCSTNDYQLFTKGHLQYTN